MAICEPVLEAATADGPRDRVATDDGEIVVAGDEGEVLEADDLGEENENCACSALPGGYPCAACYISGAEEWSDEEDDTHKNR